MSKNKNFSDLLKEVYSIPREVRGDYTILVTLFEGGEKSAVLGFKGGSCGDEVYDLSAHNVESLVNNQAQWGMPVRIQIIEAKPQKKSRRVNDECK